jgi:hypothetical protein
LYKKEFDQWPVLARNAMQTLERMVMIGENATPFVMWYISNNGGSTLCARSKKEQSVC